MVVWEP